MFRDDLQLANCCRALLAQVRLERLWTNAGPTSEALSLLDRDGGPLSSRERIMLLAAFAFWNGRGGLRLAEILETLDLQPTKAICALAIAVKHGAEHVDSRLVVHGQHLSRRPLDASVTAL
jgi:hypothetical protein